MKKNNITKIDIAKELSKKTGYSLELSKILINNLLIVLISAIKKNKLNLKNIGTFRLINKSERIGRNPKTKVETIIVPRKVVKFKPSLLVKEKLFLSFLLTGIFLVGFFLSSL